MVTPCSARRSSRRRKFSRPMISLACCRMEPPGLRGAGKTGSIGGRRTARGSGDKPHAFTKLPVTEADKERVLAQVREQGKQFGMPQELKIVYPFADTKPPFDFALGHPSGEVWLQRPARMSGRHWSTTSSIGKGPGGGRSGFPRTRRSLASGSMARSTGRSGTRTDRGRWGGSG